MSFTIPGSNQAVIAVTRMLLLQTGFAATAFDKVSKETDYQCKGDLTYVLVIDHISFQHPDSLITGREIRALGNLASTAEIWLKGYNHEPDLRIGDGDIVALDAESAERFFSVAKATVKS